MILSVKYFLFLRIKKLRIINDFWRLDLNPLDGCQIERGQVRMNSSWVDLMPLPEHKVPSFLLLPYSNRIKDGKFTWPGKSYQLAFPETHALHGPVRRMAWTCDFQSKEELEFSLEVKAYDNPLLWPFSFFATYKITLYENQVIHRLAVKNNENSPAPRGGGFHPYFLRAILKNSDVVQINLGVEAVFPTMVPNFPSGEPIINDMVLKLNSTEELEQTYFVDDVFTWPSGRTVLCWAEAGIKIEILGDTQLPYLVFYNPDRPFFAVEPVSNANDGLNNKFTKIADLAPKAEFVMEMKWDLTFS